MNKIIKDIPICSQCGQHYRKEKEFEMAYESEKEFCIKVIAERDKLKKKLKSLELKLKKSSESHERLIEENAGLKTKLARFKEKLGSFLNDHDPTQHTVFWIKINVERIIEAIEKL